VRRYQRDPAIHRVALAAEDKVRATHLFWRVADRERLAVCGKLIAASGSTIVFCRTRRRADRVARDLAHSGLRTGAIHGSRSQPQRDRALAAFSSGSIDALVATDVAARGIHVDDVACVIQFDPATDVTDYTHRAGRTARAGAHGLVVSLVDADQVPAIKKIQRQLGLPAGLTRPDSAPTTPPSESERVVTPPVVDPPEGTGIVKWFNHRKGYGFIARDGANDVFVHASSITEAALRSVRPGRRVAFEVAAGRSGDHAQNVALV
jgi:superfamily II DNA/RNA helicase/cold shock CspA family protein